MDIPFIYPDYTVRKINLHIHSSYTDGSMSIKNIIDASKDFETIAITDHVWRSSTYLDDYFAEIKELRQGCETKILAGVESKIININGEIDVADEVIEESEIILGSLHSVPDDDGDYNYLDFEKTRPERILKNSFESLINLIEQNTVNVIAHPTYLLKKKGLRFSDSQINEIAKRCYKNKIAIEINTKYDVPDHAFLKICMDHRVSFSIGSDAHHLHELASIDFNVINSIFKELSEVVA